ncbi:MAG: cobyric acid synthase [Chloroflexi bacterium]|nr:cobyric acid synthase [Chloroflexota bacterium]
MTHSLMLLGTHSSAGKSLLAAAFCRILARKGYRVAPFKAQNMSNNAGVTPEGGEMGRAQIVQAEAAGIAPHTDMNPILLKPEGNRRSQVVLNGHAIGHIEANNWLAMKAVLWEEARAAYDRLAARYDVIVLEGAGSPAEINLKAGDIVNLRMARHAGAPCLLIGDIDRGGVFAALAGTMLLLDPEERAQIRGFLINRFRGDPALLGDGLYMLQERAYGVPTLGVIPYIPDLRIAEEDAVALERNTRVADAVDADAIHVAIIQLPRISNFDEFDALAIEAGVHVRYVQHAGELGRPHAIILPGSKATLSDLAWLHERRLDEAIQAAYHAGAEIVGICGGYQLLGRQVVDVYGIEGAAGHTADALGLLPASTEFNPAKHTHQARLRLAGGDVLRGYEIHAGETTLLPGATPFGEIIERNGQAVCVSDGAVSADGRVWGTYLHGVFENDAFRRRWLHKLGGQHGAGGEDGGTSSLSDARAVWQTEYDRLADVVEANVDLPAVLRLMGLDR